VIKLASDENFDGDIVRGLLRRVPELDIVRVQDANLAGSPDPAILARAASDDRILLTHDRDTMPNFVYDRLNVGEPMPGVFLVSNRMSKGQAVDELFWAVHCLSSDDCKDQVIYFLL
jgi:predicted nuclease of predicted toxin-antitoxin system